MTEKREYQRRSTDAIGLTRQDLLAKRAHRLAEPSADARPLQGLLEIVEFRVGSERYAVETSRVREVFQARRLTSVPGTPPFVVGIINVRGKIISVVDIRGFFGLPGREANDDFQVLILQSPEMEFALLADGIAGVSRISSVDLQPTLPTISGVRAEYLKGITADGLAVLDATRMLADPGLVVHDDFTG